MNKNQVLCMDLDDVIFTERHKEFGAYYIRKNYNQRLQTSLAITFCFCGLLVASPFLMDLFSSPSVIEKTDVPQIPVELINPPLIDSKLEFKELPPQPHKTNRREIVENPHLQTETKEKQNQSSVSNKQNSSGTINLPNNNNSLPVIITPKEEEIIDIADAEEPCFPGGLAAVGAWIQTHATYPEQAIDLNLYGKVYVSFIINENGKIVSANIAKGVHRLLNEAALDVVQKIPFTCGASQNGHKVKVSMTAPVNFMIQQ